MSPDYFLVLVWLLQGSIWTFLICSWFVRAWTHNYRLTLAYAAGGMATQVGMPLAASFFGHRSIRYTYTYVLLSLALIVLALSVLLQIHSVFGRFNLRRDWHLPIGVAGVILMGYLDDRQIWPLFRLLDISYTILTFVGAATLVRMVRRRSEISLGWNLKMVLLALTLPASFYTLVFATYTMGMDLSYENATYWIQGTSLASWIILAAGMSHYSPPRRVGLPSAEQGAVLQGDSSMNQNGSERSAEAELECHIGGVSS